MNRSATVLHPIGVYADLALVHHVLKDVVGRKL